MEVPAATAALTVVPTGRLTVAPMAVPMAVLTVALTVALTVPPVWRTDPDPRE